MQNVLHVMVQNGEKAALGKSKSLKDSVKSWFVAAMKGYQDGTYELKSINDCYRLKV